MIAADMRGRASEALLEAAHHHERHNDGDFWVEGYADDMVKAVLENTEALTFHATEQAKADLLIRIAEFAEGDDAHVTTPNWLRMIAGFISSGRSVEFLYSNDQEGNK